MLLNTCMILVSLLSVRNGALSSATLARPDDLLSMPPRPLNCAPRSTICALCRSLTGGPAIRSKPRWKKRSSGWHRVDSIVGGALLFTEVSVLPLLLITGVSIALTLLMAQLVVTRWWCSVLLWRAMGLGRLVSTVLGRIIPLI